MTRVIKSRIGDPPPPPTPAPPFWRALARKRFELDSARELVQLRPMGNVTREGPDTLVLWHSNGRQVLTRYQHKPYSRASSHAFNASRKAFELLTEL